MYRVFDWLVGPELIQSEMLVKCVIFMTMIEEYLEGEYIHLSDNIYTHTYLLQ